MAKKYIKTVELAELTRRPYNEIQSLVNTSVLPGYKNHRGRWLIDQIDESLTRYRVPHNVIAGGRERNYKYLVNIASIQTLTHPNNMREARVTGGQVPVTPHCVTGTCPPVTLSPCHLSPVAYSQVLFGLG